MATIEMFYHPVMQKVRFREKKDGNYYSLGKSDQKSALYSYTHNKNFILQNQGVKFFDAIFQEAGRPESLRIIFQGSYSDCEDLRKMANYYNVNQKSPNNRHIEVIGEILDRFSVKEFYDEIYSCCADIDSSFSELLNKLDQDSAIVSNSITEKLDYLRKKLAEIKSEKVNICLVGAYSAGKSTLINALIGEQILATGVKSETARPYIISASVNDADASIRFETEDTINKKLNQFYIVWNTQTKQFEFKNAVSGHAIQRELQDDVISKNRNKLRHEQLCSIIKYLNRQENRFISENSNEHFVGSVEIVYPMSFKGKTEFCIYDTPGTDSNDIKHPEILKRALKSSKSSILLYVIDPEKMEGTGNKIILNILNNERDGEKLPVDLGRSIFVINKSDRVVEKQSAEELRSFVNDEIRTKDDENKAGIAIPLIDKRVLFVDSEGACLAQGAIRNILNEDELDSYNGKSSKLQSTRGKKYHFYQYDHIGLADEEASELIGNAEKELEGQIGDGKSTPKALFICSGVYSLQAEIEKYADKFVLATKAKTIIDSTQEVIQKLEDECKTNREYKEREKQTRNEDLQKESEDLVNRVQQYCQEEKFEETKIPENFLKQARLDETSIKAVLAKYDGKSKELKGLNETIHFKKAQKAAENLLLEANEVLSGVYDNYTDNRPEWIKNIKEKVFQGVRRKVLEDQNLDETVKEDLCNITIKDPPNVDVKLPHIDFDQYKRRYFLVFHKFDCPQFCDFLEEELSIKLQTMTEQLRKDCVDTNNFICEEMSKKFKQKIVDISQKIQQIRSDIGKFEKELEEMDNLLGTVKQKDNELRIKIQDRE